MRPSITSKDAILGFESQNSKFQNRLRKIRARFSALLTFYERVICIKSHFIIQTNRHKLSIPQQLCALQIDGKLQSKKIINDRAFQSQFWSRNGIIYRRFYIMKQWHNWCLLGTVVFLAVFGGPMIINWLYQSNSGYITIWGAAEVFSIMGQFQLPSQLLLLPQLVCIFRFERPMNNIERTSGETFCRILRSICLTENA